MPGNVLLLQGPVGPFFRRLAEDLEHLGLTVHKVNLNGGDALFYRRAGAISFTGSLDTWPGFVEGLLTELAIDQIYLFGDGRKYHLMARDIAKRRGVRVFVFEEGYLRPDYITLEEEGVNGFSPINRDPERYHAIAVSECEAPVHVGQSFARAAVYSALYYLASRLLSTQYPHYHHHRPLNLCGEGSKWLLWGLRNLWFKFTERKMLERLSGTLCGRYFLVPLQVHCDMQIIHHSKYEDVTAFIEQLIVSFAGQAPADAVLVFKHHPMDRGYRDYAHTLRHLAQRYGIETRVLYVHDLPLPLLLKHARGTVVINSTAGLSSIHHGTPVKVMGDAIYDMLGLTSQQPLEAFWRTPGAPDQALYRRFRSYLVANTQINGNFYKRLPEAANALGVIWPEGRREQTSANTAKPSTFELHDHSFENLAKKVSP